MKRRMRKRAQPLPNAADPGPITEEYRAQMNAMAETLDEFLNGKGCKPEDRKIGFMLTMFPFGEPGRFNYIANADRLDVRAMLKDVVARIEGRMMAEKETRQ